jgi:hypothetical protein
LKAHVAIVIGKTPVAVLRMLHLAVAERLTGPVLPTWNVEVIILLIDTVHVPADVLHVAESTVEPGFA